MNKYKVALYFIIVIPENLKNKTYLSKAAGSFSGVPQRTVQLWTERGLLQVPTTGTGNRRRYSVINCIEIGILKSLSTERMSFENMLGIMQILHCSEAYRKRGKTNLETFLEKGIGSISVLSFINGEKVFLVGDKPKKSDSGKIFDKIGPEGVEKTIIINLMQIAKKVLKAMI